MTTFSRAYPTADPRAISLGLVNWSWEPEIAAVAIAPTAGTIYFSSLWLPAGVPINYLWFNVSVAGTSTVPTDIFAGLENGSVYVAQTATLKSDAKWTSAGFHKFALSATYTPPASGFHRINVLQVGSWGGTQMQLADRSIAGSAQGDLPSVPWGTSGTSKTALPANGAAMASVVMASQSIWVGASS